MYTAWWHVCITMKYIYIYNSISPIQLQRYVDQAVPVPGVTSDGLLKNKNNIKQLGTEHPLLEPKSIWITWIISQITASLVDSLLFVRRLIDVLSMMCHPPGLAGAFVGEIQHHRNWLNRLKVAHRDQSQRWAQPREMAVTLAHRLSRWLISPMLAGEYNIVTIIYYNPLVSPNFWGQGWISEIKLWAWKTWP